MHTYTVHAVHTNSCHATFDFNRLLLSLCQTMPLPHRAISVSQIDPSHASLGHHAHGHASVTQQLVVSRYRRLCSVEHGKSPLAPPRIQGGGPRRYPARMANANPPATPCFKARFPASPVSTALPHLPSAFAFLSISNQQSQHCSFLNLVEAPPALEAVESAWTKLWP